MTQTKTNKKMELSQIIKAMMENKRLRLNIIKRSHIFFFHYYFMGNDEEENYYPMADFHREMFHLSQDITIPMLVISGFRGCGKSTIMGTSFPLWAILGEQKVKYVLILSKTEAKAQMMLGLIKNELETNKLLKQDRGPFREERGPWNTSSIYLDNYKAKITAASTEQSIRSFRHMHYRPQLIICDDLEDIESVKTPEARDKLYNWLLGDVVLAGSEKTRLVVLGGILHEDSLLSKLQKNIQEGTMDGESRAYPFFDKDRKPLWIERFKNQEIIEREKKKIGDELTWEREMMLNPLTDSYRIVKKDWIQKYEVMPSLSGENYYGTFISVDPAGGKSKTGDNTAMIVASVFGTEDDDIRIYIHPNPINEQLEFNEIKDRAVLLAKTIKGSYPATIIVEDAGVQGWLGDALEKEGMEVEKFKVGSVDKETRLRFAASALQAGKIFFPKDQSEELQNQLLNFRFQKHDDLVDSFSMLVISIMKKDLPPGPMMTIVDMYDRPPRKERRRGRLRGAWIDSLRKQKEQFGEVLISHPDD